MNAEIRSSGAGALENVHSSTTQRLGTILNGRYRVDRWLARGASGSVFEGTQLGAERPVAIKILEGNPNTEPSQFVCRFDREARVTARLQHPNIVTVIDYGQTEEGELFIVMERIEGQSLARLIRQGKRFSVEQALSIGIQIARALRAAHRAGAVHRDLKPSNVMMTREDPDALDDQLTIKVLDFGLVKIVDEFEDLTVAGAIVGTPGYLAPEQLFGAPIDHRADLYAFGAVFYELLTGQRLFKGQTRSELLLRQSQANKPRLNTLFIDALCIEALQNILDRTCTENPEDRFQTSDELLAALKDAWRQEVDSTYGTESHLELGPTWDLLRKAQAESEVSSVDRPQPKRATNRVKSFCKRARPACALVLFSGLLAGLSVAWELLDAPLNSSIVQMNELNDRALEGYDGYKPNPY